MHKWLVATAISLLMVFLSMSTTFASPLGLHPATSIPQHASRGLIRMQSNSSVVSCSGYGCDNLYAYPSNTNTPGTNCGGSWVGWFSGEPQWSKIYYSNTCGTNFAYVTASPDGSPLTRVLLYRRPCCMAHNVNGNAHGWVVTYNPNVWGTGWCSDTLYNPPSDWNAYCDRDYLANGQTTLLGNMLYAPVDQVAVCVNTVNNPDLPNCYWSFWH